MGKASSKKWWKESVVYQIYPRSFKDSNGDGVGDLRGIISKLDYLKSLNIDVLWLNPIYRSPNDDNGYDISDYRAIMEEFGNMADFDALLKGVHERGIKLIMDLVVNHSSDEHEWFKRSRSSRDDAFRDYYHWWPAEKGTPPKRWSYFDLEDNAWQYDETTDAYYLHYFSVKQPDLKWENPELRRAVYDMMHFWFQKGIDGFRMDVIPFISKDTAYPELPESYKGDFIAYYANGPRLHEFLQEMNREVLSKYDIMTVGEAPGVTLEQALNFVDEDRKELDMFFHFDLLALDREPGEVFKMRKDQWKLTEFKQIHSRWDAVFKDKGWGSIFLCNHDFPRSVSRWGNDSPRYWHNSATMLQTFSLSMRGTPFFYQGEEIGMTNIRFDAIEDYRDINTLNAYHKAAHRCDDLKAFLENEKDASRDNARTPMQWDTSENAGFTNGTPWIKVNTNFKEGINVAEQDKDQNSVLNYFRKMTQVRKTHEGLIYGSYELVEEGHEEIYAYTRIWGEERYVVLLSFSENQVTFPLHTLSHKKGTLLISNDEAPQNLPDDKITLHPYQAAIYRFTPK
ncbi:glycoside hydrolase family 13 protein [Robertkochia sediminum]|uniref:glycoside hydrolase family 13 protein n=1 Tax=Robertkochia sediminum TaxID=2785326 RepID=UPI0019339870|nr:alpha-glucosidase [Robertkochia sediminum]MBL7473642.1 alpha-glucosidase [Robertkochia sediminum]